MNFLDEFGLSASDNKVTFQWPVSNGTISSVFGDRPANETPNPHPGIDIAGTSGQPIFAAAAGTVMNMPALSPGNSSQLFILHTDGQISVYKHDSTNIVTPGQTVTAGQQIGTMGSVGSGDAVHLHFEIRPAGSTVQAQATDPLLQLPDRPTTIVTDANAVQGTGNNLTNIIPK